MKKLLFASLIGFLVVACFDTTTEKTMTITGTIDGLKKGKLFFQTIKDSTLITLDSLELRGDGNFSFSSEVESPALYYLYLDKADNNSINDRITFFGEPGEIQVNTAWNTLTLQQKWLVLRPMTSLKRCKKSSPNLIYAI